MLWPKINIINITIIIAHYFPVVLTLFVVRNVEFPDSGCST